MVMAWVSSCLAAISSWERGEVSASRINTCESPSAGTAALVAVPPRYIVLE
jgi:hypothetical protein